MLMFGTTCAGRICSSGRVLRQTRPKIAPHRTDTKQRIRPSFVQSEPPPLLGRQLDTDHNYPLDTLSCAQGSERACSVRKSSGFTFSAKTGTDSTTKWDCWADLERMCIFG